MATFHEKYFIKCEITLIKKSAAVYNMISFSLKKKKKSILNKPKIFYLTPVPNLLLVEVRAINRFSPLAVTTISIGFAEAELEN